ncbi:hypothetical protein [Methylobacterium sp. WL12]|uniref:hypothetical protein n=1 Tax=Methylobacterium sp. WL12 TaxID=2603890 RepID=UPI001FEFA268|nr:hypothetical protein [Methylobacterium sp. WL12]
MATQEISGLPLPKNKNIKNDQHSDQLLRFLDCAVINHLHSMIDRSCDEDSDLEPYDTVRGIFTERGELYPGSGFKQMSHTQIAVRNPRCIRGLFIPVSEPI